MTRDAQQYPREIRLKTGPPESLASETNHP